MVPSALFAEWRLPSLVGHRSRAAQSMSFVEIDNFAKREL